MDYFKIDPNNINRQTYINIIHDNNSHLKSSKGIYNKLLHKKYIKTFYLDNFILNTPIDTCKTYVIYDHSLNVAEQFADHGLKNTDVKDPVIINPISNNFVNANYGLSDDIRDHYIQLRTSLYISCFDTNIDFKNNNNCIYTNIVSVIRPFNVFSTIYKQKDMFRVPIITVPFSTKLKTINKKLFIEDLFTLCYTFECFFQTAINMNHKILIIPPIGIYNDELPIDDVILLLNYCIYKYGHLLSTIIIAIPQYYPSEIYEYFQKNIVDTNKIYQEAEENYYKEQYIKTANEKKTIDKISELDKLIENQLISK